MKEQVMEIVNYTAIIAAVIGLIRWKVISASYRPFVILMWFLVLNVIISMVLKQYGYPNAIHENIAGLIQFALIVWLFRELKLFEKNPSISGAMLKGAAILWAIENIYIFSIHEVNTYTTVCCSLVIVLMSISLVSRLFWTEKRNFTGHAGFIVCIGFITYYTFKLTTDLFWLNGLDSSAAFKITIDSIMLYVNIIVNLLYALAAVCIPRKQTLLLQ